jgi:sporulation protein YlmC with PRC-barrel domain
VDAGGKKIAEIKDLVVCDSGEVVAIVETETRDDALVGVPLCHLQVKIDEDQREAKAKDKEENLAKGAPTPDIDNFALMGDRTLLDTAPVLKDEKTLDVMWVTSSREHFGVDKNATKPEAAGERGTSTEKAVASTATKPTCVKHLIGENVKGSDGDGIGDVKDLAIDLRTNQVAYAIVSTGGMLGMGDALHAIPFSQLTITEDVVTVPMNKDGVSNLPKLDIDRLPNNSTSMVLPERGSVATDGNPDRGTGR